MIRRPELILVAEDHQINQEVARILLTHLGFEIDIANNGTEVIDKTGQGSYALIFMDCQMPGMDGFEATRELRKVEINTGKRLPIIAMTGHTWEGSREECIEAGMDDCISKPIDADKLKAIIDKWLPVRQDGAESAPAQALHGDGHETSGTIDLDKLVDRVGQEGSLTLLAMYVNQAPTMFNEIKDAVANGDSRLASRSAHALKGVFGTLFAEQLHSEISTLEKVISSGDWMMVQLQLDKILAQSRHLRDSAQKILDANQ